MREFAHSLGEYAGWKGDEVRRRRFLSDLVHVIRRHTNRDFAQGAFLDGYRAVDSQFEFHERVGHPYAICALMCIGTVRDWMAKTHPNDEVMFVFEKGDAYQDEVIQMLRRDKIDLGIDPLFIEKRWVDGDVLRTEPALECADFLAYEQHKTLTDAYVTGKTAVRTSAWALAGEGKYFRVKGRGYPVVDGVFFETAARGFNLPRRTGVSRSPIPHEFETLGHVLGNEFVHRPLPREFLLHPRHEPLPNLRPK